MHCLKLCLNSDKPPGKRTAQSVMLDSRFDDCVVQNDGRITLNQLAVVARAWNISFIYAKRVSVNGRNAARRRG